MVGNGILDGFDTVLADTAPDIGFDNELISFRKALDGGGGFDDWVEGTEALGWVVRDCFEDAEFGCIFNTEYNGIVIHTQIIRNK